tara:strand:+ start:1687 stop:1866 length:180 start_codon:yes stop_codon:yes gene_type:complete
MKVGDLVRNLNSESGLLGIIVDWTDTKWPNNNQCTNHPVVAWQDGRVSWIMAHRLSVVA